MQIIFKMSAFTSDYNTLDSDFNRLTSPYFRVMSKKIQFLYLKNLPAFPGYTTKY